MVGDVSLATRIEVIGSIRGRYREAPKKDKSRMLDEFVAITAYHRKHAVRLPGLGEDVSTRATPKGRRICDEAVRQATPMQWAKSDSARLVFCLHPCAPEQGRTQSDGSARSRHWTNRPSPGEWPCGRDRRMTVQYRERRMDGNPQNLPLPQST